MTINIPKPQQQERGFLSAPTSFRYRGAWASATAYLRGEVIIDPFGVLRYCGVSHTSPGAFATGTEYSSNSPWWGIVPTNGVFRGVYTASHGTYGTVYAPSDLVIDPNTNQLVRALFEDSAGGSWDATKYGDMGIYPPFALVDPGMVMPPHGMPNSHIIQGLGLYPRTTRIQHPRVKPLVRLNSSADFSSTSGGAVTADPDPIDPSGCPRLAITGGSGTIGTVQLSPTVDLSNSIVRFPIRVSGHSGDQVGVLGTTLSTGSARTTIPLDSTGLWYGVAPNTQVQLDDGAGHTQIFTATDWVSASAGGSVTQIPVVSLTPTFAFPSGTTTISTLNRTSGLSSISFQVSSDNFATHVSKINLYGSSGGITNTHLAEDAWDWAGGGPGNWESVTGFANLANLAAINAIRWVGAGSGASMYYSLNKVDVIDNNGHGSSKGDGRAKCTLTCDDSYEGHWTYLLATALEYGFPLSTMTSGSIDNTNTSLTFQQLHYMAEFHQCQAALHYYYPNDGGDDQTKEGLAKESYMLRARHSLKGAATWGNEEFAWHDDDHPSWMNLPTVRKYFRSARGYSSGDNSLQTLPPVNPWYIHAYGTGTSDVTGGTVGTTASQLNHGTSYLSIVLSGTASRDLVANESITIAGQVVTLSGNAPAGSASIPIVSFNPNPTIAASTAVLNPGSTMKDMVDAAIVNKALCQFAWENVTSLTGHPEVANIMAYLDAKRASIDVVTMAEALQPWTVPA